MTPVSSSASQLDLVFKALASDHRREILRMLSEADAASGKTCCASEEVCACRISDRLGITAPTTSHHMSILREAGLVDGRKDGQWVYYTLKRDTLDEAAKARAETVHDALLDSSAPHGKASAKTLGLRVPRPSEHR